VNYNYRLGELIVTPSHGFTCRTDMKTYTGRGNKKGMSVHGESTEDVECIDLEVHLVIHYVPLTKDKV